MKNGSLTLAALAICLCSFGSTAAGAASAPVDSRSAAERTLVQDQVGILNLPEGYAYREIIDWNHWLDWGLERGVDLRKPDMNVYVPLPNPLRNGTVGYLFTNHETSNRMGAVTRIALDANFARIGEPELILSHLNKPCSGNLTPWGTILIGEEAADGYVWEIQPLSGEARRIDGLGRYAHETGVVDPHSGEVWSTDDANDPAKGRGAIYKFVPDTYGDLSAGKLYALDAERGRWLLIEDPTQAPAEAKAKGATLYMKPEDAEFGPDGHLYVSITETDQDGVRWGRVLRIQPHSLRVTDFVVGSREGLNMPDNLVFDNRSNLYIVEDSNSSNQLWVAERSGRMRVFAELIAGEASGPWFTPDFRAMFLSLQGSLHRTILIQGF